MYKLFFNFRNLNYLVILVGIILATINFLFNRSLWGDESSLALNIIERNFLELLKPLDYFQAAPILYLQLTKLSSLIIPNNEMGLRLFSLLFYFISLVLFYALAKLVLKDPKYVLFALILFVFNNILLRYSNELKQYIFDVAVLLALTYFALRPYILLKNKYITLSVLGVLSVFISNIAVFVMLGVGLVIFYEDFIKQRHGAYQYLLLVFFSWVGSFAIYYYFFIYNHPVQGFMTDVWRQMGAFLPSNPFKSEFYTSLYDLISQVFISIRLLPRYKEANVIIFWLLTLSAVGFLIAQKRWSLIILLLSPIIVHLFMSSLELYPFFRRLVLYLYPVFILLISLGLYNIVLYMERYIKWSGNYIVIGTLLIVSVSFFNGIKEFFPFKIQEIKELIVVLNDNAQADDIVYVNGPSVLSFEYYQKIGFVKFDNKVVYGDVRFGLLGDGQESEQNEQNRLINEISSLYDGKYWLLFTEYSLRSDETIIIDFLDLNGAERLDEFHVEGASLYFYSISW